MTPSEIILAVLTLAIAVPRIAGVKHKSYQAVAHLFVGGLAGAWLVDHQWWYAALFVALCVVEVVCFAVGRSREQSSIRRL